MNSLTQHLQGRVGDKIAIMADDGVAVRKVEVKVRKSDGTVLEEGPAAPPPDKRADGMDPPSAFGMGVCDRPVTGRMDEVFRVGPCAPGLKAVSQSVMLGEQGSPPCTPR